jgi:hypothetical protein
MDSLPGFTVSAFFEQYYSTEHICCNVAAVTLHNNNDCPVTQRANSGIEESRIVSFDVKAQAHVCIKHAVVIATRPEVLAACLTASGSLAGPAD